MKKILILLIGITAFFACGAHAQGVDSTALLQQVSVPKSVHLHAIRCLGTSSMNSPDRINYINDLIEQGFNTKADTAIITVKVPAGMIVDVFRAASMKPEGIVVEDNKAAETALFPQVQGNSWIMGQLYMVKVNNAGVNAGEKQTIRDFMSKIKP